jgi:tRNA (uracil-5-)-methyltransferase TRM9
VNSETVQALNRINRRFYAEIADEFSATRRDPWPGWSRAVACLRGGFEPRVLDLGCGNGRFATFLESEWGSSYSYLGLDSSAALLDHARSAHIGKPHIEFDQSDFLPDSRDIDLPDGPFDLIVLFGVLHHVPSFESRRRLVTESVGRLSAGGILVVAAWQFTSLSRFRSRIVPWERYNEGARNPIDPGELEPGDFLLCWADSSIPRYCHFVDSDELDRLVSDERTEPVCRYSDDGKSGNLNLYAIVRRQP